MPENNPFATIDKICNPCSTPFENYSDSYWKTGQNWPKLADPILTGKLIFSVE